MKIRCMIVDDQKQSTELLMDHIGKVPALELKHVTTNPVDALSYLDNAEIDCIYLDVEMPELSGLEFIETLNARLDYRMPKIILITAYDSYALKGFDYGVFDYLLKPINFKRFKISSDRLVASFSQPSETKDYLFVDVDGKKVKVNFDDIVYVEGAGNYINIYTVEKRYIWYKTLTGILELIPSTKFMRVHKSFIISLKHVDAIRGNEVLMNVKTIIKNIPIGTTYKDLLLKSLGINE